MRQNLSIDGGLSRNRYFAQFLASASNRTIRVPPMHELTALGLAELCGIDSSPTRALKQPGTAWLQDGLQNSSQRLVTYLYKPV